MTNDIIKKEISQAKENVQKYTDALANLEELKTALATWTFKKVDKCFFEKHFTVDGEFRSWTKYGLQKSTYSWGKPYKIYVHQVSPVELDNTETEHIKTRIQETIDSVYVWRQRELTKIEKLMVTNEAQIKKDLLAVYEKHGKPSIWRDCLDSYEVKYPQDEN